MSFLFQLPSTWRIILITTDDARKAEPIISTTYAVFSYTRVPALTMVIMRHKSTMKCALIRLLSEINNLRNFNRSQCWYQFNDEYVTKIKTLGDRIPVKKRKDSDAEKEQVFNNIALPPYTNQTQGEHPLPRRNKMTQSSLFLCFVIDCANGGSVIRSKDAYMLIYAKRASYPNAERGPEPVAPSLPPWASKAVECLNRAQSQTCSEFAEK